MIAGILRLDAGNGLVHAFAAARPPDSAEISAEISTESSTEISTETRPQTGPETEPDAGPGCGRELGPGRGVRRGAGRSHATVPRRVLVPVAACAVAAATAVSVGRGGLAHTTNVPESVWPVLATAIPVVTLADLLVTATRGTGAMRPTAVLAGLVQPMCQLVLVSVAALGHAPLPVLVAAWALPSLLVAVAAAAWLGRRQPSGAGLTGFWRRTAPRSAAAALQSAFQRLDVVLVAVLAGPAAAAVYTGATRFKVVGQLAGHGLAQAAQPRLVRALAAGNVARAGRLYQTSTIWLVALTWPVWLGYAAFAPTLLPVFGRGYASGVPIALVLAATMLVATACGMVDVMLTASGGAAASLVNTAAAVSVTVVLDLLLVPAHGALGAALGWSGGVLVKNLLPLRQIHRRHGLRPFGPHSRAALRLALRAGVRAGLRAAARVRAAA
ncbi:lipopolysaccharide biosynthesis protein [Microbispora sp. RL4-1S]|uniref:Lipopolysaccharide biosynthesis protein n=2 Tax=Microbispora oryzae TaxID=2806554 RepID=A0A940WK77_9ACTN|nr:lipopolysaccharide biosynthesis protein [Microbispora oryzae]